MTKNGGNAALALGTTNDAVGPGGGPPGVVKPRLLLVDDEQQVLDGLALHLRRKYDVVTRTSGAAALEEIARGTFTAVISDLRMPDMDGVELLAEVRHRAPETTRVLLTGYADVTSAIAAVNEAGVHRFLTKPCPPAQLARALDEAIASAGAVPSDKIDEHMVHLERQATLGTMAGSIGHEIGNLVTALAGSLELVQSQVDRGEMPASEDIGLMALVKNRLHDQTRALRDLARPRERQIETIDVGALVCGSVDLLKKAGVLKAARTRIAFPPAPLHVTGDRGLLEGVLINLLKNASEAIAEKADAARQRGEAELDVPVIDVRIERHGEGSVRVVVEDNGAGIPHENLDRLFQTYFTTKASSGGTGLGLAIVRETIDQHKGVIDVASVFGAGTRFTVELPLSGHGSRRAGEDHNEKRGDSSVRRAARRA